MKISICYPQYNRIEYLVKSLRIVEQQKYTDLEIVISDDASTDNTVSVIRELIPTYKYPIKFSVNEHNKGFDYNYRRCVEVATGDYAIVLGNDDSLNGENAIELLADFLSKNNFPEIGFCNCIDERDGNSLLKRAHSNTVLGSGSIIALKYYSGFSFVGGLIYKKAFFDKFNTDKHDGSVYAQMYLGCLMIANGGRLFSIENPLVIKDILINNIFRNSYRDRIAKKWSDFRIVDGGLPSVINVLIDSFRDAGVLDQKIIFHIFKRIYSITLPFWIQDYKSNGALPESIGIFTGLNPIKNKNFKLLNLANKIKIYIIYIFMSVGSILFPNFLFKRIQQNLYRHFKK